MSQQKVTDERLRELRVKLAAKVVPGNSCIGCELDPQHHGDEGISVWQCSVCCADYCAKHQDCRQHTYFSERQTDECGGHPMPWEPYEGDVEQLALVDEVIASREAKATAGRPVDLIPPTVAALLQGCAHITGELSLMLLSIERPISGSGMVIVDTKGVSSNAQWRVTYTVVSDPHGARGYCNGGTVREAFALALAALQKGCLAVAAGHRTNAKRARLAERKEQALRNANTAERDAEAIGQLAVKVDATWEVSQ